MEYLRRLSIIFILGFFSCGRSGGSGERGKAQEPASAPVEQVPASITYNIYLDKSASMDGYVTRPGSDFRNNVQRFILSLRTQAMADTIDLNYVNEGICPYRHHAQREEVDSFATIAGFRSAGCGRGDTYMDELIRQVITTKPNDVNVLISDDIFSTGHGYSAEMLTQQGNKVEDVLAAELRRRDFSTIILKFDSRFEGTYYSESKGGMAVDVSHKPVRRPYYITIFGSQQKLRNLAGYIKNWGAYYLMQRGGSRPPAKIIRKHRQGDFVIAGAATQLTINRAVAADSAGFQFAVALNLDSAQMDEGYLMNPANYELPPNYELAGIERNTDATDQALQGYTHVFLIRTTDLKPEQEVYLRLKSKIPHWVYATSTTEDGDPYDSAQQKETFGFQYLVEGITRGYMDKYKNMDQFAVNVWVSRSDGQASAETDPPGGRSSFPWVLVAIGAGLVCLVVWIKNKR
jgi:hypothetical protein